MPVSSSTEHWIKPDALTINLNHFGDPDYLQVSVLAGAVVMAFKQDVVGYNAAHNYRTWPLDAANTYLETTSAYYVYARLTRSEANARALIVYDPVMRDIEGREITYAKDEETGEEVEVLGDPNETYFFVYLGQISASVNEAGGAMSRDWLAEFRFGSLNTNQYQNEETSGEWTKLFRWNKVTDMIDVLKYFSSAIFKKLAIKSGAEEKVITDIKRSTDSDEDVPISDESIPTTKYIQSVSDDKYLRKDQPDQTDYLIKFLGGLEVGEAIDSFLLGKGTIITPDGRIQTDRIEVRQSMTVMDLIINQLQGIAADYLFSDVGKVDSVTEIADRTYVLHIEKKTDFDFTTLGDGDILHMIVNDLYKGGGNYFSSWMRVLSVDTDANDVTVVLYDDDQVQGGANFAPVAGYNVARRGNVNVPDEGETNERANYWMLSSREGRIQFLQNMFKPTIEDYNYALTLGKLPDIKAIRHLPVTPNKDVGLVAQTAIVENLYQFDYNGDIVPKIVDRGNWSLEIAQSESPYRFHQSEELYPDETTYTLLEQHSVWHNGMRFRCLVDETTEEPKWNSTDWAMMDEYELDMRFTSSEGNAFHAGKVDTEITPSVYLGNIDISNDIAVIDWIWTYELGEYNGRVLHLTNELMPPNWSRTNKAKFTCTAYVRKSENDVTPVSNIVTI